MLVIKTILIVANSGRMLAQMARNSGYHVVVIDCYSDTDTQALSLECIKVDTLSLEHIKKALCVLKARYMLTCAIYGSGFERYLSSLEYLQQNIKVIGNAVKVFAAIQSKIHFFSELKKLKISYPETLFHPPESGDEWLVKPMQGEGGFGIKKYKGLPENQNDCYWQRFINGIPMSVLFVSNGSDFEICGFNKQQIGSVNESEFVFSGVISQPGLDDKMQRYLNSCVAGLVKKFGLQGFNSVDFILKNDCCYILEVNPRPTASMQLYDDALIINHIKSCLQKSLEVHPKTNEYRAYQVVFAKSEIIVGKGIQWPGWVVDVPQTGSFIHTGHPICSIIARGNSEQQVLDKLLLRQQFVIKLLK